MSVPDLTSYGIATVQTLYARTIFNDENVDGIDISTQSARLLISAGTTMSLTSTNAMTVLPGSFDLETPGNAVIESTNGTLSLLATGITSGNIIIDAEEGIDIVTTEQDINIGISTGDLNVSSDKILLKTDSTVADSIFLNSGGGIDLTAALNDIDVVATSGAVNLTSNGGDITLGSTANLNFSSLNGGNTVFTTSGNFNITNTGSFNLNSTGIIGITGTDKIVIDSNSTAADSLLMNSAGGIDIFSAVQPIDIVSSGSNVNLSSTNNDITLNTGNGSISLGATGGNISLGATGDITLTTTNNDIILTSANKTSINSSSTAADSLFLNSSGGIDITSATGNIDITNTSGDLNTITNGNLSMTTTGGGITLGSTTTVDITSGNGSDMGITSANILYLTSNSTATDSMNLLSLGGLTATTTGKMLYTSNSSAADSFVVNSLGGIDLTSTTGNMDLTVSNGNFNIQVTGAIDIDSLAGNLNLGSTASTNIISSSNTNINSGGLTDISTDTFLLGTTSTAANSLRLLSLGGSDYTVESGNFDLGVTGQLNIDASRNVSHIRNWADTDGDDLEICVKNLGVTQRNASLILCSEGNGTDAVRIQALNGGIDIDSAGLISIQTSDAINGIEIGNNPGVPVTIGDGSSTSIIPGSLTVNGNLTVNGTTTTVNSATVTVDDKNIELNSITSPTDVNADGGGITLRGDTDKTIVYNNSSTAVTNTSWDFSEDVNLGSTTNQFTIQKSRVLARNALFLNTTENINSTDGGIYLNKQSDTSDTSGDWRFRVNAGAIIYEYYNGASWLTKFRISS
jgi:uncharacterized protein (DUF2345 family)